MRSTRARLRSRPLPDVEAVLLGGRADAAWPRRRATLALAALLAGACTAPSVQGSAIALDDPLGLIDDVEAAGNDLRLLVLPDESYDCDSATGRLAPEPPDAAMIGDAVVDVSVDIAGGSVSASDVSVPPGDWVVLVRGKGTDPTSGVRDAIIASGCAAVAMLASGETREVAITLRPVITEGMCNDGILSPDEQCEPGVHPDCTAMCTTTTQVLNTTTAAGQEAPRIGSASGHRTALTYDTEGTSVLLRLLDSDGAPITSPPVLRDDTDLGGTTPGPQRGSAVAVAPNGRIAIALVTPGTSADVIVAFSTEDRLITTPYPNVRADPAGAQSGPAVAFSGDGSLLVAFVDTSSGSGASLRRFAPGSTTADGAEASVLGMGRSGIDAVALAGHASGFVAAFSAGGDVLFERLDAAGASMGGPQAVLSDAAGTQDQPAIAALSSGGFVVAFRDTDGMGSGIRARVFGADGTPVGTPIVVNTVLAGDQTVPVAASSGESFLIAWESAGSVRARGLTSRGEPMLNHERMPTGDEFTLAASGARTPSAAIVGSGDDRFWMVVWRQGDGLAADIAGRRYPL